MNNRSLSSDDFQVSFHYEIKAAATAQQASKPGGQSDKSKPNMQKIELN